jgi:hypothetical protein
MSLEQIGQRTFFIVRVRPKLRAFSSRDYFAGPSDFAWLAAGVLGAGVVAGFDSAGFPADDSDSADFL